MERLPAALALREAIGDRVPGRRIHSHADVARGDLDALGEGTRACRQHCHATMPSLRLNTEVVGTGGASRMRRH